MIKKVDILWQRMQGINSHQNQFYTSIGELDLQNCMDFSSMFFDVKKQSLGLFFKSNNFSDPMMKNIKSIEFKFLNIESFSLGIGMGWSPPPLDVETKLSDLAIFRKPKSDNEVHMQFHLNSGRIIDIRSRGIEMFIE